MLAFLLENSENDEIFTMTLILFSFCSFTGTSEFFFYLVVVCLFSCVDKSPKHVCILLPLIDASLSLSYH